MNIDAPFHIDARGRTATTPDDRHVRNMLELLLFTSPGERVNRPEFGGGVRALVFAGNGPELAAALQFNLRANLQRWLGDAIELRDLIWDLLYAPVAGGVSFAADHLNRLQYMTIRRYLSLVFLLLVFLLLVLAIWP